MNFDVFTCLQRNKKKIRKKIFLLNIDRLTWNVFNLMGKIDILQIVFRINLLLSGSINTKPKKKKQSFFRFYLQKFLHWNIDLSSFGKLMEDDDFSLTLLNFSVSENFFYFLFSHFPRKKGQVTMNITLTVYK